MKTPVSQPRIWLTALLCFGVMFIPAQVDETKGNPNKPETELHPEVFWDIKAYSPQHDLLAVKAIGADGQFYEVKAIQYAEDSSLLDVKLFMNGQRLPVKLIITKTGEEFPLKGIDKTGNLISIKAFMEDGTGLDIKGVGRTGSSVAIRALGKDGEQYSLLAMASDGMVNTIKGLKMTTQSLETVVSGINVYAHVKAMCDIEQ